MKILFCIDRYHPSRGGAESYLHDLAAALKRRGHEITVAALEIEADGIAEPLRLEAPSFPRMLREIAFARRVRSLKRGRTFDRVVGFRHILEADLFQPHEGLFLDALRGAVRPVARNALLARGLLMRKWFSPKNLFFLYADRSLFRRHPGLKVAALSRMTAASIQEKYASCRPRISVIPNGVDLDRFHPGLRSSHGQDVRAELGIPGPCRLILFAAHNFRLKGLREAVDGVARYVREGGHARLVVVGRGRRGAYARQCHGLAMEEHIAFLGSRTDMHRLFGAADVLLHPTYYDPCSLVVLEALGAGVPVITTRFNGASELMADGRGGRILEDPRNPEELARALREILDSGRYDRLREEAAEIGAANDFNRHVDRMEQWISMKD